MHYHYHYQYHTIQTWEIIGKKIQISFEKWAPYWADRQVGLIVFQLVILYITGKTNDPGLIYQYIPHIMCVTAYSNENSNKSNSMQL